MILENFTDQREDLTFNSGNNQNIDYYEIRLYSADGNKKAEVLLKVNDRGTSDKIEPLKTVNFDYGDYFVLDCWHAYKLKIDGPVRDQREDYSDGVQNSANLKNVKFIITEAGLKSVYTDPAVTENDTFNIISPIAPEGYPIQYKVDHQIRMITILDRGAQFLTQHSNQTVFTMELVSGVDGTTKRSVSAIGSDYPGNQKFNVFHNYQYEYNDYIKLSHLLPQNLAVRGEIKGAREDYSNGVENEDFMTNVRFYLRESGMEAVYNEAPQIIGADDKDIILGETFNSLEGVMVKDDHDGDKILLMESNVTGTIDPNRLGQQTITYTVEDSWGRETTLTRTITVRPPLYQNIFKVYSLVNNDAPVFEIGFDSLTSKYRVFNQTTDRLAPNQADEMVFGLEIKGSNGEIKKAITLIGNDRGTSTKLDALNELVYANGDIVRVYHIGLDSGIQISGPIERPMPKLNSDIEDEPSKLDYMKNTGYEVSQDGLRAIYNYAPEINGVLSAKSVYKGTSLNLLENVTVTDLLDGVIDNSKIIITVNGQVIENADSYTFNHVGTYTVTYQVTDSWGRSTQANSIIKVESKAKQNSIDVYGSDATLGFKVTFDTDNNRFILVGNGNTVVPSRRSTDSSYYFEMIVRDRTGKEKYKVQLNAEDEHNRAQLAIIHQQSFELYDTIELKAVSPEAVKITGSVVGTNDDYSQGFETIDKYSDVRFQITEDGLKALSRPNITISSLSEINIIRGIDIDLIDGVTIEGLHDNSEDFTIKVSKPEENYYLAEGTYTMTYTVTTSWETETTATRIVTVIPRNTLEENKVSIYNQENQKVMTIGIDTIESKFRVLDYTDYVIDAGNPNPVLRLTGYDEKGNVLRSIELNGNQNIIAPVIDRVNEFSYNDIVQIGIWAQTPKNIHIEGTISGDVTTDEEDYSNGIDDPDYMNNVRFKFDMNGVESIYYEKPHKLPQLIHD